MTQMEEIVVRPATEKDIPKIIELQVKLGRPAPKDSAEEEKYEEICRWYLNNADAVILMAEADGEIVGMISMCYLNRLNRTQKEAWIPDLIIDEEKRRKGIGKALFWKCVELAKERRCFRLRLESAHHRTVSHQFYLAQGMDDAEKCFNMWFKYD